MTTRIFKGDTLVAYSRNLRGVLSYAREHGVNRVTLYAKQSGPYSVGDAYMFIAFGDGAFSTVDFASYMVAKDWIKSRRSWAMQVCGWGSDYTVWRA